MRIFKKLGIVLAFSSLGAMLLGTTVCAKQPPLTEGQKQIYEYCRVYDPNRMNYDNVIRDYANQYVSYGYQVFDLYYMFYSGFIVTPNPNNSFLPLSTNGINVLDSVEHPSFSGVFMKVSHSDYEAYTGYTLDDRMSTITKTDYSDDDHCTYTQSYDPRTEVFSLVAVCDRGYTLR